MTVINIWVITILTSLMLRSIEKRKAYKDISDLGYKFNHEKLDKLNDGSEYESVIVTKTIYDYSTFVPILNLIEAFIREGRYNKNKMKYIKELKEVGALEEMTEDEKEEYNKNKTGSHAIKIETERLKKIARSTIAIADNGSKYWYNINKKEYKKTKNIINNIVILKIEGEDTKLSKDEQKKKLYNILSEDNNSVEKEDRFTVKVQDIDKIEKENNINNLINSNESVQNEVIIEPEIVTKKVKVKSRIKIK